MLELVRRIKQVLREDDLFARLGGDEFGILLHTVTNNADADSFMQRIIDSIGTKYIAKDTEIMLGASIGYALYCDKIQDIQELIDIADQKKYANKKARKANRE